MGHKGMDVVVLFILHKISPVASHIITHVNYFNCSVSCDFGSATYNKLITEPVNILRQDTQ